MATFRFKGQLTRLAEALVHKAKALQASKDSAAMDAILFIEMWIDECMASLLVLEPEMFLHRQEQGVQEAVIDETTTGALCGLFGDETPDLLMDHIREILRKEYGHGFNHMELAIYTSAEHETFWIGFRAAPT